MNVFCYESCYILSFPLWSHMTNTVNSSKFEVIIINLITRDLSINVPWSPIVSYIPILFLDPSSCSKCGNCTICISWIMHKIIIVSSQNIIDPDWAFKLNLVSFINIITTFIINCNFITNVKCSSYIFSIKITRNTIPKKNIS